MFKKGASGNPGGRPKGLMAYVQEKCGDNGERLINALWTIAFFEKDVQAKDRIKALEILLDRGWNKPMQGIHFDEKMKPLVVDLVTEADVQQRRDESED